MNNLHYAARQVFKPKLTNVIKLISLHMGLGIGAMLFTALAYNFTYDNFYEDSDRIYVVYADYVSGGQHSRENFAFAPSPVGPAAQDEIRGVELYSRFYGPNYWLIHKPDSDIEFAVNIISADKNYFKFFKLDIIAGDTVNFAEPGTVFLSETKAKEIFSTTDVIGKSFIREENTYTVKGLFEDIPDNSSWHIDAVEYCKDENFGESWIENGWCNTFLMLSSTTSEKEVEKELEQMQGRHYDVEGKKAQGQYVTLYLEPLESHHNAQGSAMSANIVVLVLGIVILSISGLNYVLLSISSINSRAKEIGVHKCNGASKRSIFSLLLNETLIYILLAAVLGFLGIAAVRGEFETMTSTSLVNIFRFENLYAVVITVLVLFLLSGIIPAQVFSSIPVTQVFMQQSNKRTPWKKALLLVQLFATVFILCFLLIVIRQNNVLFNESHGINMDPLVITNVKNVTLEKALTIRDELERKENVRVATISNDIPLDYPNNANVVEAGSNTVLFSSSQIACDERFLDTYGIPLLMGTFHTSAMDTNTVTVNEKFLELAGWTMPEALGKHFVYRDRFMTIGGVVKNFHISNYKILEQFALILSGYTNPNANTKLSLALNTVSIDAIKDINNTLEDLLPLDNTTVVPYKDRLFEAYEGEMTQKKIVATSAVAIFILSFIGVISYISTEVNRLRREIAIRRINGATIPEILKMLSKGISYYALSAAILGSIGCVLLARNWQQEFFVKATLAPWIFIAVSLGVMITVIVTTIIQSYHIVSTNPAEVIRSSAQ